MKFTKYLKIAFFAAQPGDHCGQGEGAGGLQRCHERRQGGYQLVRWNRFYI